MATFETGKSYTLDKLFSGDNTKIIIPDLQRDYCWGGHGRQLVQGFVGNLVTNFSDRKPLSLGLLYGYEEPAGHIQLCDGQQRITTLFLLVGMLNRACGGEFRQRLISDFEYFDDDKEPYLQYAIRENSLYFLSDLVCKFFIEGERDVKGIKGASWYFKEYDNDPSIQSMLAALAEIEEALKPLQVAEWSNFAKYITGDLSFMYYDMKSRAAGEETFVVINTTGEPLSPTENLKPRYVDVYKDADQRWEEWETWFWQHRNHEKNDTADAGMLEFFRWVVLLETVGDKAREAAQEMLIKLAKERRMEFELIEGVTPDTVESYLDVVKQLFKSDFLADHRGWLSPDKGINDQIDWFRLLPLISWARKFPNAPQRDLVRVWQFFNNLARLSRVGRNVGELLPQAIGLVEQMTEPDIAKTVETEGFAGLLTKEERAKFQIFLDAGQRREDVENLFWSAQEGQIWSGQIMPLIEWSTRDGKFDFDEFRRLHDTFYRVFKGKCDANIDPVRRALLTRGLKDYPRIFSGYTNHSFGWEWSDWKTLIFDNVEPFGTFIRELADVGDIDSGLQKMIGNFHVGNDWAEFVHEPELLKFCLQKNIQWHGKALGWVLMRSVNMRGEHANLKSYRLFLDLKNAQVWDGRWRWWFYDKEATCAVLELDEQKIAIDIYHSGDDLYTLQLFLRGKPTEAQSHAKLGGVAQTFGLDWNGERFEHVGLLRPHTEELLKQLSEKL